MIRIEYLFFVISLVLGMILSTFVTASAQSPLVRNPYAQGVASSAVGKRASQDKQSTTQEAKPQRKTKPVSAEPNKSIAPLLEAFALFAPDEADCLLLGRPSTLGQVGDGSFGMMVGASSNWMPFDLQDVDCLIFATSHELASAISTSASREMFENIASQLEAATDNNHKPVKVKMPSVANELNQNVSGLIRFKQAKNWDAFSDWLDCEDGKYKPAKWNGHEVLENGSKECCVVVRLNKKTYVLTNREAFQRALQSTGPKNMVADSVRQLAKSNFLGDWFVAVDLSEFDWGDVQGDETMGLVTSVKAIKLSTGYYTPELVSCQIEMTNPESAKTLKVEGEKLLKQYSSVFAGASGQPNLFGGSGNGSNDFPMWQAKQIATLSNSLEFSQQAARINIVLPRPANFEEMMETRRRKQEEYMEQLEDRFLSVQKALTKGEEEFRPFPSVSDFGWNSRERDVVQMGRVLVWSRAMKKGEVAQGDDIKIENWPKELVPNGVPKTKKEIVGRKVQRSIYRGSPIQQGDVPTVAAE